MNVRGAKQHFSIQALQICDAFLIWLGFVIASFVRGPIREVLGMPLIADDGFKGTVWIIFIVVPLTPLVLERFGFYDRLLSRKRFQSSSILLRAMLAVVLIIALIAVFGKYSGTKRLVLGSGLLFSSGFLWIRSRLTTKFLRSRAASEGYLERVVLAGTPEETGLFLEDLESEILETWKIVAHFDLETKTVGELDDLIKQESIQRVVFLTGHAEFSRVAQAVETCELQGVEAWIGATFLRAQVARPSFDAVGGRPMLVFRSTPELSWQLFAKKLVDLIGALVVVILTRARSN